VGRFDDLSTGTGQTADDETAKEYAKQLVDGHDIKPWQQERLIAKTAAPK